MDHSSIKASQQQHQNIQQLLAQGKLLEAYSTNQQLLNNFPSDARAWIVQSIICFKIEDKLGASNSIEKARKLEPDNLAFHLHQVMALEALGQVPAALKCAAEMAKTNFKDMQFLEPLASFMNKHQQFENAESLYQQAILIKPNNAEMLLNLAMTKQYLGDMQGAEEYADRAIDLNPDDGDVHFFLAHLKRQDKNHNHIQALKNTSQKSIPDTTKRAKVYFALAKEYEDCQEYQESFAARQQGAKLYRSSFQYDPKSDLNFLQAIRQNYTADFFKKAIPGQKSNAPIFIVGLPRSGTTLLERIIGSHSEVTSAGELTQFNRCMLAGLEQMNLNPNLSREEMVAASVNMDFLSLGKKYLESVPLHCKSTPRFIDKFPQNSQYLGLINKALPNAKILILERNPLDVCYAVYKQMFTDIYQFSYDLEELAEYYIEHKKLMDHWQAVLPESVKVVRYENMVENLEATVKEVLDFCELAWEDQCLNFHTSTQASTTASASQVRQKVYSSSIDMWKNYEKELKPLIDRLTDAKYL